MNAPEFQLIEQPKDELPAIQHLQPLTIVERALDRGASLEQMRELMALQERHEANEARKAFVAAKAAFKAEDVVVTKDRENKQYGSRYTSLGHLVTTVTPLLSKHGLSASWDQTQDDGLVVTCTLAHAKGHSESTSLKVPPDTSGQKNPIQQIKSAITYAKAVTFESICGLASTDANFDDDGNGTGDMAHERKRRQWLDDQKANIRDAANVGQLRRTMEYALGVVRAENDQDAEDELTAASEAKVSKISPAKGQPK